MSGDDLDRFYHRASEQDRAQPNPSVRRAILERARQLTRRPHPNQLPATLARWFGQRPWRGWQFAAPVAAAVLATVVLAPQLRSRHLTSLPSSPVAREAIAAQNTPAQVAAPRAAATPALPPAAAPPTAPPSAPPELAAEAAPAASKPAPTPAPAEAAANLSGSPPPAAADSSASATSTVSRHAGAPAQLQENATAMDAKIAASRGSQGELLRQAAMRGDTARVRELLESDAAPIDSPDSQGRTALLLAIIHRREAVTRELLKLGANPSIPDIDGQTALSIAQDQDDAAMVRTLVQAGAR